jgi:hypothetical protein
MMALTAILTYNSPLAENWFTFGKNALFDGSSHKYATDAEEYLLKKIGIHRRFLAMESTWQPLL